MSCLIYTSVHWDTDAITPTGIDINAGTQYAHDTWEAAAAYAQGQAERCGVHDYAFVCSWVYTVHPPYARMSARVIYQLKDGVWYAAQTHRR